LGKERAGTPKKSISRNTRGNEDGEEIVLIVRRKVSGPMGAWEGEGERKEQQDRHFWPEKQKKNLTRNKEKAKLPGAGNDGCKILGGELKRAVDDITGAGKRERTIKKQTREQRECRELNSPLKRKD